MAGDKSGPRASMANFQMLSDEDLKASGAAAGAPSKPGFFTRMRARPLTSLAIILAAIIALVLVIALPVALTGNDNDSNSGGSSGSSGSSGSGSGSGDKPTSTSSGSSAPRPTKMAGCGNAHTEGWSNSTDSHSIRSGGTKRTYAVDVPSGYNDKKSEPWPLIMDFHGASRDTYNQYNNSQYFMDSRGDDYIIVYPQGRGNVWEGAEYAIASGGEDITFVSDLLEHLDDTYCIDSERVYASGKSNGGGFVDMLACSDAGDAFAAFAMAAAALYSDNSYKDKEVDRCQKSRAILESHGGKDDVVPYEGQKKGNGGSSPDIPEWLGWWARRDGCKKADEPVVDNDHDGYNITSYSCDGYDNVVQGYHIPDLNHCWPSADGNNSDSMARNKGCAFEGLDFTSVVLDWFGRWNRTSAPQN